MIPVDAHLSTPAKTCLDNVDAIYKLMVEGWTSRNPDHVDDPHTLPLPQDPPNQLPQEDDSFVLNLVPCDPTVITQLPQQETAEPPPPPPPLPLPPNQASPLQEQAHHASPIHTSPQKAPPPHTSPQRASPNHTSSQQASPTHTSSQQASPTHTSPQRASSIQESVHQMQDTQPPQQGRQSRKKKNMKDCPHNQLEMFAIREILKTRNRKGRTEHLYDWQPCTLCGKTWPPSWQPA
ncbi:uncharacterized protein LOC125894707 [Epinephelus fuscoguttatus]|uniref:uncharacterized protein LOC125894707 n=1 Tax=Epinephelus fuscoguttatus TaxID=293821 RepID=UPI0020D1A273|nr:uncharacterized protein LOC125894707 [Epinephelus fuscoguttatus]